MRGKFISFEGGEGAGKSTQARMLRDSLESHGRTVLLTREPGGSRGAEEIRKLLVEGEPERWTPLAETLLFIAARADHVARLIGPALNAGTWVISDRFADSTFVYQGIARGLGIETVRHLQRAALGGFAPDLTIILDMEPQEGLKRAAGRGLALYDKGGPASTAASVHQAIENRFERFDAAFHARLRDGFLRMAVAEPARCSVIDGSREADAIAADVWRIVAERLQP
ncbi:MAG TPA: dTMP kinase [Micropepsaceae bacterium]|jgi:dTMP kinase|nr:dTMP kinase [Micropepsaceae bacterium]